MYPKDKDRLLTICKLMDSSLLLTNNLETVHCTYQGMSGYNFHNAYCIFCLMIFFTFANSVNPDEMPHNANSVYHDYAVFHLGLHCL